MIRTSIARMTALVTRLRTRLCGTPAPSLPHIAPAVALSDPVPEQIPAPEGSDLVPPVNEAPLDLEA
jgi:hypothetical protein